MFKTIASATLFFAFVAAPAVADEYTTAAARHARIHRVHVFREHNAIRSAYAEHAQIHNAHMRRVHIHEHRAYVRARTLGY